MGSAFQPNSWQIIRASVATTTASLGTEANTFTLPVGTEACSFWIKATGVTTGTTPTVDLSLQWTPDNGTTWLNAGQKITQITTAAIEVLVSFRSTGLSAAEATVAGQTVALSAALAAYNKNAVVGSSMRWAGLIGGTNPTIVYGIWGAFSQGPNYSY